MLQGNIHLMDKSEVRIIKHKLTFTLKTEQVPLRYKGFKMVRIFPNSSFRGECVEEFWRLKSSYPCYRLGLLLTLHTSPLCLLENGV
jgi:hypothetical protein